MSSSDAIRVLVVIAIVVYVIGRQLLGEPLRAKRVVILPAVLAIAGLVEMVKSTHHARSLDIVLVSAGAVIALAIGIGQGTALRIEARDGYLWGKLPVRALWYWLALIASRAVLIGIGYANHAHLSASTDAELLVLGINRLGQAGVVLARGLSAGVPFAPENGGLLGGLGGGLRGGLGGRRADGGGGGRNRGGGAYTYEPSRDRDAQDRQRLPQSPQPAQAPPVAPMPPEAGEPGQPLHTDWGALAERGRRYLDQTGQGRQGSEGGQASQGSQGGPPSLRPSSLLGGGRGRRDGRRRRR